MRGHRLRTRLLRGLVVTAALAAVIGASACGGGGSSGNDKEAIRDVIRGQEQAWNDRDFDAFKALHTAAGLKAQLSDAEDPDTEAGLKEAFALFTQDDKEVIDEFGEVKIDGGKATAHVEAYTEARENPAFAAIVIGVNASFVKDGGAWKIDGLEFVSPQKSNEALVHVDANEFAFGFNPADITGREVAFEVANVGKQPHQFILEKIPDALDIPAALQSEEDPAGAVHIGSTPPWDPGKTYNIVLTEDLEPGRYVMLCFMPDTSDPQETSHASKGMYKDFRVE